MSFTPGLTQCQFSTLCSLLIGLLSGADLLWPRVCVCVCLTHVACKYLNTLYCTPGALYILCKLDRSLRGLWIIYCHFCFSLLHSCISSLLASEADMCLNECVCVCVSRTERETEGESMRLHASMCALHACVECLGEEVHVGLIPWLLWLIISCISPQPTASRLFFYSLLLRI